MAYHRCHVSSEVAEWLEEELKSRVDEVDGLFSYVTSIGSASNPNGLDEEIGHDYDIVTLPAESASMGEFVSEVYSVYQDISQDLKQSFSESKIGVPFPESHVQNQALESAAIERAKNSVGEESNVKDLYSEVNKIYPNLVGIHGIACASVSDLRDNMPPGFLKNVKNSEPILGEFNDIPEKRYENRELVLPYLEGVHKHSGALAAPETFSDTQVTGAVLHGIDQAQKEIGQKLARPEKIEDLENESLDLEEEIELWETALSNLDKYTQKLT